MNRWVRIIIVLAAVIVLLISGYQVFQILTEYQKGTDLYDGVAAQVVEHITPSKQASETASEETDPKAVPISVDFSALMQQNSDIIGWIYCEGTPISYPVVQSYDNDYYLRRMLDGNHNDSGTIFMDYRNDPGFGDACTFIYGHNMKNDSMFGTLTNYTSQDYYENHPVIWFLTEEKTFKIELFGGMVVSPDSEIYQMIKEETLLTEDLNWIAEQSDFHTDMDLSQVQQIVILSTCSYAYEDARYVLAGKLVPVTEE